MHIRTAKDILGFPSSPPIADTERNRTHPKHEQRNRFVVKTSKSPGKKTNNYYEHRIQHIQAPKTPVLLSIQDQLREWEEGFTEGPKKVSQHRFAHPMTQRKAPISQLKYTHYTSGQRGKSAGEEIHWPRISQTQHQIRPEKQETGKQVEVVMRSGRHVLRRPTMKLSLNEPQTSKQIVPLPKDERYYIGDIKKSVLEYINNKQYVDPYLSHLMDSIYAFQVNLHIPMPKYPPKTYQLPPPQDKITLIFDLDETLLHTQMVNEYNSVSLRDCGSVVEIATQNGQYYVNLKLRPHASQVLGRLREKFELGVFTASQEQYGTAVLNMLDPQSKLFSFRLFRQHCFQTYSRISHVKDLRVLKNRELSKVVLIDNSPQAYLFQKCNAIPIVPFFSDPDDNQLLKLQSFLNNLQGVADVRPILREYFKLDQYHNYKNILRLIKELY